MDWDVSSDSLKLLLHYLTIDPVEKRAKEKPSVWGRAVNCANDGKIFCWVRANTRFAVYTGTALVWISTACSLRNKAFMKLFSQENFDSTKWKVMQDMILNATKLSVVNAKKKSLELDSAHGGGGVPNMEDDEGEKRDEDFHMVLTWFWASPAVSYCISSVLLQLDVGSWCLSALCLLHWYDLPTGEGDRAPPSRMFYQMQHVIIQSSLVEIVIIRYLTVSDRWWWLWHLRVSVLRSAKLL